MRFGVHLAERESVCVYGVSVCVHHACVFRKLKHACMTLLLLVGCLWAWMG